MGQRVAPTPNASTNVPRDFDADLLRPGFATLDDLIDDLGSGPRPQAGQGRIDEDGWYTPPPTPVPLDEVRSREPATTGPIVRALLVSATVMLVGAAALAATPTAPVRVVPALDASTVDRMVADGFARLDVDAGAAAAAFRRALQSEPWNGAALLGYGEAMLASDRALAGSSLCAASAHDGAVRLAALGLLDQAELRCD